jgi:hypothetical protein
MTKTLPIKTTHATANAPRKAWTPPRIDRIDAGQAEVGTRAAADGAFSTS